MLVLAAPIALSLFGTLVWATWRSAALGVGLILLFFVWRMSHIPLPTVPLGGVADILPYDIVFSAIACAGVLHMVRRRRMDPLEWMWLVFGVVVFLALSRGVFVYGVALAAEIRGPFYLFAGIFYLMMSPLTRETRNSIAMLIIFACYGLSVVIIHAGLTEGIDAFVVAHENWGFVHQREFHAYHGMLLLSGALISLYMWRRNDTPWLARYGYFVFFPMIIAIQFRSVWLVSAVLICLLFIFERELRTKLFFLVTFAGAVIVLASLVFIGDQVMEIIDSVAGAAQRGMSSDSTLTWRMEGWYVLVTEVFAIDFSLLDQLFGEAAGAASTLDFKRTMLYFWPHNVYILLLLRTGLAGAIIFVTLFGATIRRLLRAPAAPDDDYLPPRLLGLWLIGLTIFYWAFHYSPDQTVLIGVAASVALRRGTEQQTEPEQWQSVPSAS